MTMTIKNAHYRCFSEVSFQNVSDGYSACCEQCDEDLFDFEYGSVTLQFDVGGLGYNSNTNKGQRMKSNITRSHEVIENLKLAKADVAHRHPYAYAFGWAWAMLTEKQRDEMLKLAEAKAKENN